VIKFFRKEKPSVMQHCRVGMQLLCRLVISFTALLFSVSPSASSGPVRNAQMMVIPQAQVSAAANRAAAAVGCTSNTEFKIIRYLIGSQKIHAREIFITRIECAACRGIFCPTIIEANDEKYLPILISATQETYVDPAFRELASGLPSTALVVLSTPSGQIGFVISDAGIGIEFNSTIK
jgi:hypothetical protein